MCVFVLKIKVQWFGVHLQPLRNVQLCGSYILLGGATIDEQQSCLACIHYSTIVPKVSGI